MVAGNKAAEGRCGTEQFKPHIPIHKLQAEKDNWEWQGRIFENFKANPSDTCPTKPHLQSLLKQLHQLEPTVLAKVSIVTRHHDHSWGG